MNEVEYLRMVKESTAHNGSGYFFFPKALNIPATNQKDQERVKRKRMTAKSNAVLNLLVFDVCRSDEARLRSRFNALTILENIRACANTMSARGKRKPAENTTIS